MRLLVIITLAISLTGLTFGQKATPKKSKNMGVHTKEMQSELSPAQALMHLKNGNKRFVAGTIENQKKYRRQVSFTASGQYPYAAIVSCLDSRVSVEDIFDLNNGDAFGGRVAGNVINGDMLGSLEFATKVSGAKVILVLGHTKCGAIKGACDDVELGNLTGLLDKIAPAVDIVGKTWKGGEQSSKNAAFVEAVGEENVRHVMRSILKDSPVINELVDAGKLLVVGGVYDLETGKVRFLD